MANVELGRHHPLATQGAIGARDCKIVRTASVGMRERLPPEFVSAKSVFLVVEGCLACEADGPNGRRHIVDVHYPSDLVIGAAVPDLAGLGWVGLVDSQIGLLDCSQISGRDGAHNACGRAVMDAVSAQLARAKLRTFALGVLSGEQRLSSLLFTFALRFGVPTGPSGVMFAPPMGRGDMAACLALNPDTLSRMMSGLKARGVLASASRSRLLVPQLHCLADLTPIAPALRTLHGPGQA